MGNLHLGLLMEKEALPGQVVGEPQAVWWEVGGPMRFQGWSRMGRGPASLHCHSVPGSGCRDSASELACVPHCHERPTCPQRARRAQCWGRCLAAGPLRPPPPLCPALCCPRLKPLR